MSTFVERLEKEASELCDKKVALNSFLLSDNVKKVSDYQHQLLREQLVAMESYHQILVARLSDIKAC